MEEKHHSAVGIQVDEHGLDLPARAGVWRRARIVVIVVGVLLAAGAARTIVSNVTNRNRLDALTAQNARQYVNVVHPADAASGGRLSLPGTLRGYVEAPIYARASGYVLRWQADIGAHVKQGQLLAELDTPELNQELAQATAQRQQAQAALALAKTSFERAQQLRQRDAVSQQELDDRQGAYNQGTANLAAADANVRRLTELKGFQRIVAPIDGIVTQRNVDVGDLVSSGNAGRALFTVVQADRLRLYVQVPQAYAQQVKTGQHVSVAQAELPGQTFDGTITRTSEAIDVATRSLQIEITLPNPDGRLLPGAYVQATLPMAPAGRLSIPANTLLFRAEGPTVATVDAHGQIRLKPVTVLRTVGQTLEIDGGITPDDRLVVNPSDALANGDQVVIAKQPPQPASGAAPGAKT
ncbi:efflux RND transporter periplasmic adaptor subunit [Burkholderia stagnalis]|uniref:Efflux RND transporter periplasmic adaptor subunit n=1 Tax=Burkholderia stagnalis TaxID=1503054 RepID=A0ABX9YP78_9BURK|nr:efflux RND transporter periplasmic adaptor subunit [Burkholderia stagnalis]RQQ60687.1 efflux RND transporter periplasmic adaptor subunit [Burkholderia stagnalis]RQQ70326.1 efflux RND transporter periplasmic adaptor subunit [Burkholderia stagnalis]RQQ71362.1 efflux RND transporter periplasmic adaptor subunit [Burkholderia stagnalis]RQQ83485.1 efflux RND transporter periplasmic adaptor subunit [Burkholderia stagnalis]RQQ91500.1 efflux RND transporter periplasmic adaptor subunit [Burkholderia 